MVQFGGFTPLTAVPRGSILVGTNDSPDTGRRGADSRNRLRRQAW